LGNGKGVDTPSPHRPKVAVIGGGVSGLAAAHRLRELAPEIDVTLLEASDRPGGVLQTVHTGGYLIERSADNFITNVPWALDLCRRIGFEDELIPTNEALRKALVLRRGRLHDVPEGFVLMSPTKIGSVLTTPLLSPAGKLRLAWEYFVARRKAEGDESLASFTRRRLGRQAFERLVQPLIGGIYTADPERLSMAATMPRFQEMERRHGGLIRGARAQQRERKNQQQQSEHGARYGMFVAPRRGMSSLIDALAAKLPADAIQLGARVSNLGRDGAGWRLDRDGRRPLSCDAVIVALRASQAGDLLENVDPSLSSDLKSVPYAGASVVCNGYRADQIDRLPRGFGFVVPAIENRRILAGSFSSHKFPGRAPEGRVLVRTFIGGRGPAPHCPRGTRPDHRPPRRAGGFPDRPMARRDAAVPRGAP